MSAKGHSEKKDVPRAALPILIGFLAALLVYGILNGVPELRERIALQVFDVYQRLSPRDYQPAPVRVVDIDEESLARYGQWPWPRHQIARLVNKLADLGAAVVAFDVVFSERDRTAPDLLLREWIEGEQMEQEEVVISSLRSLPDPDQQLAGAFQNMLVVGGYALTDKSETEAPKAKGGVVYGGSPPQDHLLDFKGAIRNLPVLEESASGLGFFSFRPDFDNVVRRIPLFASQNNALLPSLSMEALRLAVGARSYLITMSDASIETPLFEVTGLSGLRVGPVNIPVTGNGHFWLHYRKNRPDDLVPIWRILENDLSQQEINNLIAGHILFVGTSADGLMDIRATPLDPVLPGVNVHMQALEQVLLGHFLKRPDWAPGLEFLLTLFFGLLPLALLTRMKPLGCIAVTVGVSATAGLTSWWLYVDKQMLIDPTQAIYVSLASASATILTLFVATEKRRERLRKAFAHYISPELVNDLVRNPDHLRLGGETRDMTILFSDIRGFTTICENKTPEQITWMINQFLTPMTGVIQRERGTIDKYIGDAIMAFWGAPVPDERHAEQACVAALDMIVELENLNAANLAAAGESGEAPQRLRIGIGINSGDCLVGNLGSEQRFNYSVLGDTVNLASRIEGQTKTYGAPILVSEETTSRAPGFACLEIDTTLVKGRSKPVKIFALIGTPAYAKTKGFNDLAANHQSMINAIAAGAQEEAQGLCDLCRSAIPSTHVGIYGHFDRVIAQMAEEASAKESSAAE